MWCKLWVRFFYEDLHIWRTVMNKVHRVYKDSTAHTHHKLWAYMCVCVLWMCMSSAVVLRRSDTTLAELTLYTIRVAVRGGHVHISKISTATILPPHTGLTHPPQLTLSHDRDLKYTTGSGSSDSLLCTVSQTGVEWHWGESQTERERDRVIKGDSFYMGGIFRYSVVNDICSNYIHKWNCTTLYICQSCHVSSTFLYCDRLSFLAAD